MKNKTHFIALTLLALSFAPAALAGRDNFNDGNDNGWTRYAPLDPFGPPATYSFPDGGYRIQAPPSPNPALLGPGRAGSYRADFTYTDFFVAADVVTFDGSLDQGVGLVARIKEVTLGQADGYGVFYFPIIQQFVINRFDNEIPVPIAGANLYLDPAGSYYFVFAGRGAHLMAKVFDLADPSTPLAEVTVTDYTYTSGFSGLLIAADFRNPTGAADATFDNYIQRPR